MDIVLYFFSSLSWSLSLLDVFSFFFLSEAEMVKRSLSLAFDIDSPKHTQKKELL